MDRGLITKVLDWLTHPFYAEESVGFWLAGLAVILIASFLWAQVVGQIE